MKMAQSKDMNFMLIPLNVMHIQESKFCPKIENTSQIFFGKNSQRNSLQWKINFTSTQLLIYFFFLYSAKFYSRFRLFLNRSMYRCCVAVIIAVNKNRLSVDYFPQCSRKPIKLLFPMQFVLNAVINFLLHHFHTNTLDLERISLVRLLLLLLSIFCFVRM